MDAKVLEAGDALGDVFAHFDKTFDLDTPYLYGSNSRIICALARITQGFGAYWYHPDHLGSSSYITNLNGEISQHTSPERRRRVEYLPFGETLVEEHLNSNNSPYKFNAKEFDAETGNYYYGARYYDPKWSTFLKPDPALESSVQASDRNASQAIKEPRAIGIEMDLGVLEGFRERVLRMLRNARGLAHQRSKNEIDRGVVWASIDFG